MHKLGNVKLNGKTKIMGIINTSPESFYKKSITNTKHDIIASVVEMENNGAAFIDVGGMSTAPYLSTNISAKLEAKRVLFAIKIIQQISNIPISVDTCNSYVAKQVLDLGIDIINDITGLKHDKNMIKILDKYQPSLILSAYGSKKIIGNQLIQTKKLLKESLCLAKSANIPTEKIVLDPGIGFFRKHGSGNLFTKISGDWTKRDILIIKNIQQFKLQHPILVSVSRKSFIGNILKKSNPDDRLYGSLAAEAFLILNKIDIIRTHDVSALNDIVNLLQKLQ